MQPALGVGDCNSLRRGEQEERRDRKDAATQRGASAWPVTGMGDTLIQRGDGARFVLNLDFILKALGIHARIFSGHTEIQFAWKEECVQTGWTGQSTGAVSFWNDVNLRRSRDGRERGRRRARTTKVCGRCGAVADAPLGSSGPLLQPAGSPRWGRSVPVLSSVTATQGVPTRPSSSPRAAERVLPGAGERAASEADLPRRRE